MSDVAALRAEIKAWEHDFKKLNGRPASVQDIRDQPHIAEKYKRYKKLSKSSQTAVPPPPSTKPLEPPSTPPRQTSKRASILPKSQAIYVPAPSTTSNPFSPVKDKGKQRDAGALHHNFNTNLNASSKRVSNPFATPSKPKPSKNPFATPSHGTVAPSPRPPSPDLFPPINPAPSSSQLQPVNPAVVRARKRLRGEPISPSPVKEKRARIVPSQSIFASRFDTIESGDESSDADERDADAGGGNSSSVVDDTPVKRPEGNRSFTVLFAEASRQPQNQLQNELIKARAKTKEKLARSKTVPNNGGLFGRDNKNGVKGRGASIFGEGKMSAPAFPSASQPCASKLAAPDPTKKSIIVAKKAAHARPAMLRGLLPGKDDLWAESGPGDQEEPPVGKRSKTKSASGARNSGPSMSSQSQTRPSTKRARADPEDEAEEEHPVDGAMPGPGERVLELLPPSPPPAGSRSSKISFKGKGKGKAVPSRKKARLSEEADGGEVSEGDEDDSFSEPELHVKVSDWSWNRVKTRLDDEGEDDLDDDPVLSLGRHRSGTAPHEDFVATDGEAPEGQFLVDLPDHLKTVLSISPSKAQRSKRKEERVVRGLLYGEKVAHYDPKKGEIWDIGEISDGIIGAEGTGGGEDSEDADWEGEPVPWMVGEL